MTAGCPAIFPKTMLAPMEGVSSAGTRALLASYAPIGLVCAPFIRITDQLPSEAYLRARVQAEKVEALSMQLLGRNAGNLTYAAKILSDAGVSVVDLNFGCPSRQVMKKGVGAALLSDPAAIGDIVASVKNGVKGLVSAKIRGGIDQLDETLAIALAIEKAGADFLVVHPRSSRQGYSGIADWRWVRVVKSELTIPVVGNGDCWYAQDALRLMAWSGCDAIMLGRAALRNPFIFGQINALCTGKRACVPTGRDIVRHLVALVGVFELDLESNWVRVLGAIKEQAQYLLRAVSEPTRAILTKAVLRAQSTNALLAALAPIADVLDLDLDADGPLRLEQSAAICCAS